MPVVTGKQALKLLAKEVRGFEVDELLEVYNEVFEKEPYPEAKARQDPRPLVERLVEYINSGLEVDVLMDLWGTVIPKHRNLWWDEVDERYHYDEPEEAYAE